jgi:hypothetical protein
MLAEGQSDFEHRAPPGHGEDLFRSQVYLEI